MDRLGRGESLMDLAPARAHLVGLSGGAMSGLAQLLAQKGSAVTASDDGGGPDTAVERLRRLGVKVHRGHSPRACPRTAQVLVYGPGVGRAHPERLAASRHGVAQDSALDCLGRLMEHDIGLAVAGGREAGTASAMIAWVLTRAGFDPSVLLGNDVPQLGGWARVGSGQHCVVEALDLGDELGPRAPQLAVLLDVEAEGKARIATLRRYLDTVPRDGAILAHGPNALFEEAVSGLAPIVEWFSLEPHHEWWGADLRQDRGRYRFRAFRRGRFVVEIRLQVPGRRQVLSALAAVAACHRLGVAIPEIQGALEEFTGLARDFESRGSYRGVTLVDDASRDAAAVAEALATVREVFGSRRLCAVFGVAGSGSCGGAGYVPAFSGADYVLITEGGAVGESDHQGPLFAQALVAAGARARWMVHRDDLIGELDRYLEPGDVLVTLGSGAVGTIADAFIRRLRRDRLG